MKILHVASHAGVFRGGAVQLCRMAEGQRRRGHDVSVVVNSPKARADAATEKRNRDTWKPLDQLGIPVRAIDYGGFLGGLSFRRLIRSQEFDIIHAHRDEALMGAASAVGRRDRPRLIAQRGTTTLPPNPVQRVLQSDRVRAVVAVAQTVKNVLVNNAGISPHKVHVIYGSVDLARFGPRDADSKLRSDLNIPPDARVIGSLSAYRKAKNLEGILRAAAPHLASQNLRAHLVFIGAKVHKHLRDIEIELGVRPWCHFMEHQADVPAWLSIMDFTIVAARSREGLSGVLRESLAMEVPVISTDCSGNGEIVRDRETGLLVPLDDPAALSGAIGWALEHPGEMKAMARAGRLWVEANCSMEIQTDRLLRLYESVLHSAKGNA